MARSDPAYIDIYISYGTVDGGVMVRGRALEGAGLRPAQIGPRKRDRLRATWHLFETDEIAGARVEVVLRASGYGGHGGHGGEAERTAAAVTDEEGFFAAHVPGPLPAGNHTACATLRDGRYVAEPVVAPVLVHPMTPGLAVISDIDDTVLRTGVTDKVEMLRRVLFSRPDDLETFDGAPALYQRFAAAGIPMFFVSGSPWNLEPRLRHFFARHGFPAAPMLLKDLGIGREADSLLDHVRYKTRGILGLMAALPARRFVLIGDSGERDPEIYGNIAREYPHRVAMRYIHRVTAEPPALPRFDGAVVFDSYRDVLRDAEQRGLFTAT